MIYFFLAWIASKVKSVTPAPAPEAPTTSIPAVINAGAKGSGGSMGIATGDKLSTRRRGHSRKKQTKTTPTPSVTTTNASANDDDQGPSNGGGDDDTKAAIKRVVRAIFDRQSLVKRPKATKV